MNGIDRIRLAAIKAANACRRQVFGQKWTPRAAQVLALARKNAATMKHECVMATHFTLALGHLGEGWAAECLKELGFEHGRALAQAQAILGTGTVTMESTTIPFTDETKRILALAQRLSVSQGLLHLGTDHIFAALLQRPEPLLTALIESKGLKLEDYRKQFEANFRDQTDKMLLGKDIK